jgi:negative regulator of sigma E activity
MPSSQILSRRWTSQYGQEGLVSCLVLDVHAGVDDYSGRTAKGY